jgi:hypothetical protein
VGQDGVAEAQMSPEGGLVATAEVGILMAVSFRGGRAVGSWDETASGQSCGCGLPRARLPGGRWAGTSHDALGPVVTGWDNGRCSRRGGGMRPRLNGVADLGGAGSARWGAGSAADG